MIILYMIISDELNVYNNYIKNSCHDDYITLSVIIVPNI